MADVIKRKHFILDDMEIIDYAGQFTAKVLVKGTMLHLEPAEMLALLAVLKAWEEEMYN